MKQLIIKSEDKKSNKQALDIIYDEMKHGDSKKIIWFTNLGEQISTWEMGFIRMDRENRELRSKIEVFTNSMESILGKTLERLGKSEELISSLSKKLDGFIAKNKTKKDKEIDE